MKFQEFKSKALGLFNDLGELTSRQVAEGISPSLTIVEVNPWLKKMVDAGMIARKKDETFATGLRYVYYLSVKPEIISEETSLEQTWQFALKEMNSFASSMFSTNTKPHKLGKECLIEVRKDELMKVINPLKHALQKAMSVVCGGKPSDYQVTLIAPAIDLEASSQSVWEEVLLQMTPFLRPLFAHNLEPIKISKASGCAFRVVNLTMTDILKKRQDWLSHAIANVLGGNAEDYSIEFCTDSEAVESNQPAPVIDSIPDDIKSEFTVKSDGSATITLRGAARLLGINHKTLSDHFAGGQNGSKLAESLIGKGFDVGGFGSQGIPDTAFGFIVTYYAFKAGRHSTPQAEAVHDAFEAIGVRAWIQNELGWKPQAIAKSSDLAVSDNLNALVLSIQGLATSAQSQQAMINDQQSAIRDVISGLNHIGQSIQVHGEKIHEHEAKIFEFDNYIQQQESLRKDAMRSVLGVKPTVQAPPKDPRAQLIHLVNNYVFAKGLGKEGHGKTWANLYRDIELRCHCSLEVERKKLEAKGMKYPKKIDAVESLGLIDTAVAIACEILEVAQ